MELVAHNQLLPSYEIRTVTLKRIASYVRRGVPAPVYSINPRELLLKDSRQLHLCSVYEMERVTEFLGYLITEYDATRRG
jgi:hypothetical protein